MKKFKINKIIKVKHEGCDKEYTFLFIGSKEPIINNLVVCHTCYGRSIGVITSLEAEVESAMRYGLKPCSIAKPKDLVKDGWIPTKIEGEYMYWRKEED